MLSIRMMAVATIAQATNTALPVKASNWVSGFSRMNRVSVSDFRNRRRSGKCFSISACALMASCVRKSSLRYHPSQARVIVSSDAVHWRKDILCRLCWGKCCARRALSLAARGWQLAKIRRSQAIRARDECFVCHLCGTRCDNPSQPVFRRGRPSLRGASKSLAASRLRRVFPH